MISPERRAQRLTEEPGPEGPEGSALLRTLRLGGCRIEVRVQDGAQAPPAPHVALARNGRHARPLQAPGPSPPQLSTVLPEEQASLDLRAVEARARGMAEGLRIVAERSQHGARSLGEVSSDEPRLRQALELAGASRGRRIWFLGVSGRRLWPDEIACVSGCYAALAEAARLGRGIGELRGLEYGSRKQAYELMAEAQSALRKALRELAGVLRSDQDQQALFDWLHDHIAREGIYVERHMRSDDLADPWSWRERIERIRERCAALREPLRQQRQVDELLALVRYHATKIPERRSAHDRWRDWARIDQSVAWLVRLGSAGAPELSQALAGVALRVPDGLALSAELVAVLAAVRRPGAAPPSARGRAPTSKRKARAPRSLLQIFQEAEARHPARIAYRPNNHSDRDYPYHRPGEVEAAVRWLVGPYWETRAGQRRADHRELDLRLRKACGWIYRTAQSPSTVGRYRSWYETSLEGRRIEVLEHIGRGNTKRQGPGSIRIGFTWDEATGKIVIGFVGQHQRNRDS